MKHFYRNKKNGKFGVLEQVLGCGILVATGVKNYEMWLYKDIKKLKRGL